MSKSLVEMAAKLLLYKQAIDHFHQLNIAYSPLEHCFFAK